MCVSYDTTLHWKERVPFAKVKQSLYWKGITAKCFSRCTINSTMKGINDLQLDSRCSLNFLFVCITNAVDIILRVRNKKISPPGNRTPPSALKGPYPNR